MPEMKVRVAEILARLPTGVKVRALERLTGVKEGTIRNWKAGRGSAVLTTVTKFAGGLGLEPAQVLGHEPLPPDFPPGALIKKLALVAGRRDRPVIEASGGEDDLIDARRQVADLRNTVRAVSDGLAALGEQPAVSSSLAAKLDKLQSVRLRTETGGDDAMRDRSQVERLLTEIRDVLAEASSQNLTNQQGLIDQIGRLAAQLDSFGDTLDELSNKLEPQSSAQPLALRAIRHAARRSSRPS
jgi:transcriptional regulator with XRE-family HTH domain